MAFRPNKSFRSILDDLGLTTGLQICLDAGDAASYTSGQSWLSRAPGGYDFFRGATGAVEGTDPTFNGTAGDLLPDTYWLCDGTQYFTGPVTPAAFQGFQRDNAVATVCGWVYVPVLGVSASILLSNCENTADPGFIVNIRALDTLRWALQDGLGGTEAFTSTITVTAAGWVFYGVSFNEAANVRVMQLNGLQETSTATYATPAVADNPRPLTIGAFPGPTTIVQNGTRFGFMGVWNRALSAAELMSIYQYPGVAFSGYDNPISRSRGRGTAY